MKRTYLLHKIPILSSEALAFQSRAYNVTCRCFPSPWVIFTVWGVKGPNVAYLIIHKNIFCQSGNVALLWAAVLCSSRRWLRCASQEIVMIKPGDGVVTGFIAN